MLGNISKKKGDNGDFYTKPVIDKKLKDAETATKAYTDKAAADAKNDLYAEVGEKVGAVEETVKARLDSTDTKLDTKVDKVSGKSLIDSGVADNLEYDTDKEEILIKVSEPSQGLRVKSTAFSESTKIESGSITIESDASGLGNSLTLIPFGGIMINTNNENADVRLVKTGETHRLSQKADKTDLAKKADKTDLAKKADKTDLANKVDKVNGKTLIDKTVADFLSDYGGALQVKCGIFADGAIESYSEIIARGDITAKDGHDVIAYVQKEAGGSVVVHKLSEKIGSGTTVIGSTDKIRLESADNVGPSGIEINPHFSNDIGKAFIKVGVSPTSPSKTVVGTGSITGSDMEKSFSISGNDIVCSPNSKVTHRLSQKVDKVEGKSLIDEQAAELMSGDPQTLRVHGNILTSEGEVTVMASPTYGGGEPIEHKLTEKANMSNSSGGFAAGEGAYAYGTKEVASGEIGLLGMTDLNAIQLGTGTNGQEFSVQVYDYVLVVSDEERGKKSATDGKKYIQDVGKLSDLTTTDKSSIVAAINEVKSSGGGDVLDNLTYDSTNDIINSSANLLLENSASVAAYNGTFRGDIKIGQLGANKWAYRISPITGFSTSVDVTCTSGNVVHNLSAKADTTNVLTRNNTQTFTPTGDYQPATKKYVDDAIAALKLDLGLD